MRILGCSVLALLFSGCGSDPVSGSTDGSITGADGGSGGGAYLIENYSPPGGGLHWTCPDGTKLVLSAAESKQSTICMGIDGSECPGPKPGPGDAQCEDPAFNKFKGTCVAAFFDCFDPGGTCSKAANNDQGWTSGAKQDRNPAMGLAQWIGSAGPPACVTGELVPGTTTVRYTKNR